MMTVPTIIPYERKFREDMLSLMFYSRRTHSHLDWHKAGNWLDAEGRYVELAYERENLIGFMGVSRPVNSVGWVRLMAIERSYDPAILLSAIWDILRGRLTDDGVQRVMLLVINNWMARYLPAMGFHYVEDVVTMHRSAGELPTLPPHNIRVRNGYIEDLRDIARVDHAAFPAQWQMSLAVLRHSQRQAASCTVAEVGGRVVGYQISTRHHTSGHLARLAVNPDMQGQRVGAVLLDHLIQNFDRRRVTSLTVNTQRSNLHSQRLYERYGFLYNGFDLPIWECDL